MPSSMAEVARLTTPLPTLTTTKSPHHPCFPTPNIPLRLLHLSEFLSDYCHLCFVLLCYPRVACRQSLDCVQVRHSKRYKNTDTTPSSRSFTMSNSSSTTNLHETNSHLLPGYSRADPEISNLMREQERRFTTITLKEIRYPLGCPCHPRDAEQTKKAPLRSLSPDSRPPLYVGHSRPEFVERTNSTDSTASSSSRETRSARRGLTSFFRRVSS